MVLISMPGRACNPLAASESLTPCLSMICVGPHRGCLSRGPIALLRRPQSNARRRSCHTKSPGHLPRRQARDQSGPLLRPQRTRIHTRPRAALHVPPSAPSASTLHSFFESRAPHVPNQHQLLLQLYMPHLTSTYGTCIVFYASGGSGSVRTSTGWILPPPDPHPSPSYADELDFDDVL